jgi:hypothetical protein
MREYFDEFDQDGSGDIGPEEFRVLCRKLEPEKFADEEALEVALLELDADGDGAPGIRRHFLDGRHQRGRTGRRSEAGAVATGTLGSDGRICGQHSVEHSKHIQGVQSKSSKQSDARCECSERKLLSQPTRMHC